MRNNFLIQPIDICGYLGVLAQPTGEFAKRQYREEGILYRESIIFETYVPRDEMKEVLDECRDELPPIQEIIFLQEKKRTRVVEKIRVEKTMIRPGYWDDIKERFVEPHYKKKYISTGEFEIVEEENQFMYEEIPYIKLKLKTEGWFYPVFSTGREIYNFSERSI